MKRAGTVDAIIMAAAVGDFTPATPAARKLKKEEVNGNHVTLELRKTKDILGDLAHLRSGRAKAVVGFALETHDEARNAKKKLKEKKLDFIVLNNPLEDGAGFGTETNVATIFSKGGRVEKLGKCRRANSPRSYSTRFPGYSRENARPEFALRVSVSSIIAASHYDGRIARISEFYSEISHAAAGPVRKHFIYGEPKFRKRGRGIV